MKPFDTSAFLDDETAVAVLERTPASLDALLRGLPDQWTAGTTWVAHDLDHIAQIARVVGRQYTEAVGPWRAYLRIISPV